MKVAQKGLVHVPGVSRSGARFGFLGFGRTLGQRQLGTARRWFGVGAGAGVVADSIPEKEWEECKQKAKVFLDALEMIQ